MITFRDYMESALYDPQNGYYAATRQVMADFVTAPEVHHSFGAVLADEVAARLKALQDKGHSGPFTVVEMGPGDGRLARVVLSNLRAKHPALYESVCYAAIERSGKFLKDCLRTLSDFEDKVLGFSSLEDLPEFTGVFFSNELVDAFPVHLLEKREGKVYEVYVARAPIGDGIRVELGGYSRPELEPVAHGLVDVLEDGERHAVNLEAGFWLRRVASKLRAGCVLTIDYGKRFAPDAAVVPRVFFKHRLEDFPTRTGQEDITASVDFEALIREGEAAGLKMESYNTLARFLLDRGILERMPVGDTLDAQKERSRMKMLFHPDGMGERYKVLIQTRNG